MTRHLGPSLVRKRSVFIRRGNTTHKTSISPEDAFWKSFREFADEDGITIEALISQVDARRLHRNLTSAIRLFVLERTAAKVEKLAAALAAVGMAEAA